MTEDIHDSLRVVAFGASAGGIQALRPIISNLHPNGVCAYIIAHHLAPDHASHLAEILCHSSNLPVSVARNGERVAPDRIYVCPRGCDITIQETYLVLTPSDAAAFISPSIDRLYCSMAEHHGDKAVAIVLSGAGHDGTIGTKMISRSGGVVMVQSPEKAVQPSMPEAVIQAGHADLIGSGEQIADWLTNIQKIETLLTPLRSNDTGETFARLFELVSSETGVDLGQYKEATLRRQTMRRFRSLGYATLEEYLEYVSTNHDELHLLQQSFLISVSSFFRDPSVFKALSDYLSRLVAKKRAGDSIRVWIPGCATGEEVYSIAIILGEILGDRLPQFDVRIFATDIDQDALEFARAGVYPGAIVSSLGPDSRLRWFTSESGGWRISKEIRELCVFSMHDVIAHPPFIKVDLISCRNLLIYFKQERQSELISTFHYALNHDGLLLLGNSESVGFNSRLFESVDGSLRLYRRMAGSASHSVRFARLGSPFSAGHPRISKPDANPRRKSMVEVALGAISKIYGPPAVLVNSNFEPQHFFGSAQRYFALSEENVDFSIFALCLPELRGSLKALCYRLIQEDAQAIDGVESNILVEGELLRVKPRIRRLSSPDANGEFNLLICFEEFQLPPNEPPIPDSSGERYFSEVVLLRKELADTREHLQSVIEELETSNEELQSLNEEVQSSSEELQSSNEELQSSNEELTTLNDELRAKSLEADDLAATLSNIQNSISSGLVVVDRDGRITRYNPLATRVFGLVPKDVGQFLYGIPCHLNLPNLRELVTSVVATGDSIVERVHQGSFHFVMQLDPYRDEGGGCAGVVVTFVDISDLYKAEEAQKNSEIRFKQVWDASLEGLLVVDKKGHIVLSNPALQSMFGYSEEELFGQNVEMLVPLAIREQHVAYRNAFMDQPHARQMGRLSDVLGQRKDSREFNVDVSLSAMIVEGEHHVLAAVSDITLRKEAELELRRTTQRLQLALDAADAGIWEWNLETNENFWSDELWNLYGVQKNSAQPSFDVWKECVHPDDRERVLKILSEAVGRNSDFEFDWRVRLPDGTPPPRWLLARGQPILGNDGKPTHYIGIVVDISERKRAEAEIQKHRSELEDLVDQRTRQLSALYNQAPCGYHSLDRDGVFINVNDTELKWLGYEREEFVGRKSVVDVLTPASYEVFRTMFPRLMEVGEVSGAEVDFICKNGTVLPVLLQANAVFDEQGRFLHSLSTIIDNTERKRTEAAWLAARDAAESANRAKSTFLANMSHEIRTPLGAIIGLTHIMKRGDVAPVQAEYLAKIDSSANHLLGVINDILDLSKIEADKFVLDETDFDLPAAVANVVSMLHERTTEKSIALNVECDHFPFLVRGDLTRFSQALLNLAGNAVKFTDEGSVIIRVRQQAHDDRIRVRVEVEDTGIGIPSDDLARLFAPFEQVDASSSRRHGGTGLGLVITRRLAILMGGDAGVESVPGRGSTFWFTALLKPGPSSNQVYVPGPAGTSAEEVLKRDFTGTRLLVVEDEPINQEIAMILLNDVGLDVTVANNGLEAVDLAANEQFSLILMDMQMPELDGLDATRRIRELSGRNSVPILAMTANAFAEDRVRCLEAGMNDFITKPFDPKKFYTLLLSWLRKASRLVTNP